MSTEQRPKISSISGGQELKNWYWLKQEIVEYARSLGVSPSGGKFEIIDRIAHYLDTGEKRKPATDRPTRPTNASGFDWHKDTINDRTLIDTGCKNSQNVRRYFASKIDGKFSFNIAFMAWMKESAGKTMGDAVAEWKRLETLKKSGVKPDIPFHNQFNAYVRAIFDDNPDISMDDARKYWKYKRNLPGHNRYERSDLDLGS